jgi:hypothetical protein
VEPDDWSRKVPKYMRVRTDSRELKYLEVICKIIERVVEVPCDGSADRPIDTDDVKEITIGARPGGQSCCTSPRAASRPLLGAKRTCREVRVMSAFDPLRTFAVRSLNKKPRTMPGL